MSHLMKNAVHWHIFASSKRFADIEPISYFPSKNGIIIKIVSTSVNLSLLSYFNRSILFVYSIVE